MLLPLPCTKQRLQMLRYKALDHSQTGSSHTLVDHFSTFEDHQGRYGVHIEHVGKRGDLINIDFGYLEFALEALRNL